MAVTELACLHLRNNHPLTHPSNETLYRDLRQGIIAQAEYTNAKASIISQIQDPSVIYIIGSWSSVKQHMEEWVPSARNQEIMGALSRGIELVWILHFDLDQTSGNTGGIPHDFGFVEIARCFVSPEKRDAFESVLGEKKRVDDLQGLRGEACGWRLDCDGASDEESIYLLGRDSNEGYSLNSAQVFKGLTSGVDVQLAKWEFTARPILKTA